MQSNLGDAYKKFLRFVQFLYVDNFLRFFFQYKLEEDNFLAKKILFFCHNLINKFYGTHDFPYTDFTRFIKKITKSKTLRIFITANLLKNSNI